MSANPTPSAPSAGTTEPSPREKFLAWFAENYPSDSVIMNSAWHAERIWGAVAGIYQRQRENGR